MTTPETREFHVGDILSAITGTLLSPRLIEGMYDLLGYMTGEPLWTHQLPRASRECEPSLREQFPDLAAIEPPDWSDVPDGELARTVRAWLDGIVEQHGETRLVHPLAPTDHTSIDPLTELRMMRPDMPVITVVVVDE